MALLSPANTAFERTGPEFLPTGYIDPDYPLARDQDETRRLELQHDMHVRALGYLLHPAVEKRLGPGAHVIDLATGSGRMVVDMARELSPDTHIEGCDLSELQFPPASKRPSNVTFSTANIKQPFPEHMKNKYDAVTIQVVVSAMEPDEWDVAARNIFEIVKPGGAILWLECDFVEGCTFSRDNVDSQLADVNKLMHLVVPLMSKRLQGMLTRLPEALVNAGFQDLFIDLVNVDREPENRKLVGGTMIKAGAGCLRWARVKGLPDALTFEEIKILEEAALRDAATGAYSTYKLRNHIAFKPM